MLPKLIDNIKDKKTNEDQKEIKSEDEIKKMQTTIIENEKTIKSLRAQLSELEKEINHDKANCENPDDKHNQMDMIQMLQEQIGILSGQIEILDTEKSKFEASNQMLLTENKTLAKKLEIYGTIQVDDENDSDPIGRKVINSMEKFISENEIKHDEEKKKLEDKIAYMNLKILSTEETIENIKEKNERVDNLERSFEATETENKSLKERLKSKEITINEMNDVISKLQKNIKENTVKINELQVKLNDSEASLKLSNNKFKKKEKELNKVSLTIESSDKKVDDGEKEKYELIDKNKKLEIEIKEKNERIKKLTEEKEDMEKELIDKIKIDAEREFELESDLKAAEESNNNLKKQLEEFKSCRSRNDMDNSKDNSPDSRRKSAEKIVMSKIEEIKSLHLEICKLKARSVSDIHNNEQYKKLKEELETEKKLHKICKEKLERIQNVSDKKLIEELALANKTIENLKIKNKSATIMEDEKLAKSNITESFQKQYELLRKENLELKATLIEAENYSKSGGTDSSRDSNYKLSKVTDEFQQMAYEVISAYTTISTNSKSLLEYFKIKRIEAEGYIQAVLKLTSLGRSTDQERMIMELEEDIPFIKGFPKKSDQIKVIVNCLQRVANKKTQKIREYQEEIEKYIELMQMCDNKVNEYEQKMVIYS